MKKYIVHSIFKTLQGEGYWTGRLAVFCRFAGCNLWTGREEDRAAAVCRFCDTEFRHGDRFTATELANRLANAWGPGRERRFVVLTGGEPMLQVDWDLVATLHRFDFYVATETNGTMKVDPLTDWITVSPKAGAALVQMAGNELKLVFPQPGAEPERYEGLKFGHRFLSPMWSPDPVATESNVRATAGYCLDHPEWRLSLQSHKILGIP